MNKELGKLIKTYNDHLAKNLVTPFTAHVLYKQRKGIYEGKRFKSEDVLVECGGYIKYVEMAMLKPNNVFGELLSHISTTHKVVGDGDCELKCSVLEMEEESLKHIWAEFKKNPNKYGYKIKLVKNELEAIANLKESILQEPIE